MTRGGSNVNIKDPREATTRDNVLYQEGNCMTHDDISIWNLRQWLWPKDGTHQ